MLVFSRLNYLLYSSESGPSLIPQGHRRMSSRWSCDLNSSHSFCSDVQNLQTTTFKIYKVGIKYDVQKLWSRVYKVRPSKYGGQNLPITGLKNLYSTAFVVYKERCSKVSNHGEEGFRLSLSVCLSSVCIHFYLTRNLQTYWTDCCQILYVY